MAEDVFVQTRRSAVGDPGGIVEADRQSMGGNGPARRPCRFVSGYIEQIELDTLVEGRLLVQRISLPVKIQNHIEANPRTVYFSRGDLKSLREKGTSIVKKVMVEAQLEEPYQFQITSYTDESPVPFFKLHLVPVKENRLYRLEVTIDQIPEDLPEERRCRSLRGEIKLFTSDPLFPEIHLPCFAFF